jgi:hypothetical protein
MELRKTIMSQRVQLKQNLILTILMKIKDLNLSHEDKV